MAQQGGYAPITASGMYGTEPTAAYGIALPSNVVPMRGAAAYDPQGAGAAGDGAWIAVPRDFWRSSGFGLILLVGLVIYFDVRVLNK